MTKVKTTEINEHLGGDVSPSMATLHPQAGSSGDGAGEHDVAPGHTAMLSAVMGSLAAVDTSTLTKYYDEMMSRSKAIGSGDVGVGDNSESNKNSINMKASDAVGHAASKSVPKFGQAVKEAVQKDMAELLEGTEGLTEDFKTKAATIFEAAINARMIAELVKLEEENEVQLQEAIDEINETLTEKVKTYSEYVAEEWLKENEVAVESTLRNEISSEFIAKLRDLFIESNIDIPEDQIEVVDTLASKVDELEAKLGEAIEENANLKAFQEKTVRKESIEESVKGLTLIESEKVKELAEGIDTTDPEEFKGKLKVIREGFKGVKTSTVETLMEEVDENNKPIDSNTTGDPEMRSYLEALGRTRKVTA